MNKEELKKGLSSKIWYLAEPIVEYWVITNMILLVVTVLTQGNAKYSMLASAIAMTVAGVCFLYRYRGEKREEQKAWKEVRFWEILLFMLAAGSLSLWINAIFIKTGFVQISPVYQQVSSRQYSVSLWGGIILYGMISPFAEELVFRGMLQSRARSIMGKNAAILLSACFFAIYHGNIIQGIYAFCMGVLFAYCYERYQTITIPIILHGAANILSFTTAYTGYMAEKLMTTKAILFFIGISVLSLWIGMRNSKKTAIK